MALKIKAFKYVWSLLLCMPLAAMAQFTGPTNPSAGVNTNYTYNDGSVYVASAWAITNGTVISFSSSGTTYSVTVQWTAPGSGSLTLRSKATTINSLNVFIPYGLAGGGYFCSGGNGVSVTLNGSDANYYFQLYKNGVAYGASVLGTGSAITWSNLNQEGTYTARTTDGFLMSGSPYVGVSASPAIFTVSGGGSFCAGGSGVTISLLGSETSIGYQLLKDGANVGSMTPGNGGTMSWSNQTTPGIYTIVAYNEQGCFSTMTGSATVTVNPLPATPSTPSVQSSCGAGVLAIDSPPAGVTWYWQNTNASGTSTTNSASNFSASTSSAYYIRARNNSSGCWSTNSSSINVTVNPLPPPPPAPTLDGTVGSSCGTAVLSQGTPPAGMTWYWQDMNASGTSMTNSGANYSAPTSGTYYVRSRDNTTGCWSPSSSSVSVTINPLPASPSAPTIQSNCGIAVLSRGTPGSGVTWYWQDTNASGISTANSSATYSTTMSGTYYLRSRDNTSACWSANSSSISVTINLLPATPSAPTIQSNCGSAVLSQGTSAAGVTWYWQDTNASGTSTTNSAATYSTTTSGIYYLRSRDNTSGCWSTSSSSINVTINLLPAAPSAPTIQSNCGTAVLSQGTPTAGVTWYWQDTNATSTSTTNSSATYPTTISGTYYLRARNNTSACWSSSSSSIIVSVQLKPTVAASNQSIFSNQPTSIVITNPNNVSGTTYSWTVAQTNVSGGSNGSGSTIGQTLITTTSATGSATYTITPTANGCIGNAITAAVAVLPKPIIISSSGSTPTFGPSTLDGGLGYASYDWRNSSNAQVGTSQTLVIGVKDSYTVKVTKTGITGSGISDPFLLADQMDGVDMNYIISNTVLTNNISSSTQLQNLTADGRSQTIQYFDGLGRPIQNVVTQGSPQKIDIVQPVAYDEYGRESKKYLPFASGTNGQYKIDPVGAISSNYAVSAQYLYYNNGVTDKIADDTRPFSETVFEASPLNRPLQDWGAGQDWKDNNKSVGHRYIINKTNEVILFTYDPTSGLVSTGAGSQAQYYDAGQLQAKVTTDENNNDVIAYADKLGHTVCKKVQYQTDGNGNKLYASTYYIYDDFGNLVVVLPPEAVNKFVPAN